MSLVRTEKYFECGSTKQTGFQVTQQSVSGTQSQYHLILTKKPKIILTTDLIIQNKI